MTDNQFDDFIRSKLQDHSAPVPAGLWDKVNPAKKDDGRKGIILPKINRFGLLAITVLLLGTAGGYLYFNSQRSSTTAGTAADVKEQPVTITGKNNGNTGQSKSAPESHTGTAPGNINNDPLPSSVHDEDPAAEGISTNVTGKSGHTLTVSGLKKNNTAASVAREFQQPNRAGHISNTAQPIVQQAGTQLPTTTAAVADKAADADEREDLTVYTHHSRLGLAMPIRSFHGDLFNMDALYNLQLKAGNHAKKFPNIIVCPTDRRGNQDWFAEVYVSPNMAFKSIENRTATPQYLQKKDSSERMQPGYSAGIRLVKPIYENLLLKTGLQYTQVNEKFTYRTENEITTTTVITTRTIIRAPGDTIIVSDTSVVQQIGYKTNTIRNRYRSIDIPLTVGYQFGNENLSLGVNAGVIFNISSWYQGVVLDSSLSTVPISKNSNMMYKKNIGLGLYAGFSILKKLNEDTQLFFEPYFRYNLSSMTNSQASFNQRIHVGGLLIGLRYNLNRR